MGQNLFLKEALLLFGNQLHSIIVEDSLFSKASGLELLQNKVYEQRFRKATMRCWSTTTPSM